MLLLSSAFFLQCRRAASTDVLLAVSARVRNAFFQLELCASVSHSATVTSLCHLSAMSFEGRASPSQKQAQSEVCSAALLELTGTQIPFTSHHKSFLCVHGKGIFPSIFLL